MVCNNEIFTLDDTMNNAKNHSRSGLVHPKPPIPPEHFKNNIIKAKNQEVDTYNVSSKSRYEFQGIIFSGI